MLAMAERKPKPKVLGEAQSYDELAVILAARRRDLGHSQMELGYIAGLQDGYVAKLELGHKPNDETRTGRTAGPKTLYPLLKSLKVKLLVVEDDAA